MSIDEIRNALAEILSSPSDNASARQRCPKPPRHHQLQSLAVQLFYVSSGKKTAYLWDSPILCASATSIQTVIRQLQRRRSLAATLRVVCLADDVLVINRIALQAADFASINFIDVSASTAAEPNRRPRAIVDSDTLTQVRQECVKVRAQICSDMSEDAPLCTVSTKACVPTIFGVLLGYPVCYWTATDADDNCLAGVALNVYQLWHQDPVDVTQTAVVYSMSCVDMESGIFRRLSDATTEWFRRRATESGLRLCVERNRRLDRVVL